MEANNPKSKIGTGIGAFNLVSKEAYEAFGTHEKIKMRPDDDLQLGMKMKKPAIVKGLSQRSRLIEVEWYGSLKEAFVGLEKNTFAGLNYRISMVFFAIFGVFITNVLPFIDDFFPKQNVALLSLGNILISGIHYIGYQKRMTVFSPVMFLVLPITAFCLFIRLSAQAILPLNVAGLFGEVQLYRLSELREKD